MSITILRTKAVLPNYTPATQGFGLSRNALIEKYFNLGLSGTEIISFLSNIHGIILSLRQLRRILKSIGCQRRKEQDSLEEIVKAIENELRFSGNTIGYRAMHQRLILDHRLTVKREVVRKVLKILDPEGVSIRAKHRLRRRVYRAPGPNYLWHIDGYDKLKPFGFCIHGCIDGYSRRILWLEAGSSNNDPRIVAGYYLDYVRELGGTAKIMRSDRGTENGHIETMQRFFRHFASDSFAGDKSFIYVKSTSNQRIEAWLGSLRRGQLKKLPIRNRVTYDRF